MADRDNADRMGDTTDSRDKPDSEESGLSAEELAARLGVSPRTIRRWAKSGKLSGETIRGPRGPELRFSLAAVVSAQTLLTGSDADKPDRNTVTKDKTDTTDRENAALRQALATAEKRADLAEHRIAGAQQAARVMALRMGEALAALDRERQRAEGLAEDLAALRQELRDERERAAEREQQHVAAERELRVLLLRSSESLAAVVSSHQAPALEAPRACARGVNFVTRDDQPGADDPGRTQIGPPVSVIGRTSTGPRPRPRQSRA